MKGQKAVLIGIVAVLAVCAVLLFVLFGNGAKEEDASSGAKDVVFSLNEDVYEITVSGRQNYTLKRLDADDAFYITDVSTDLSSLDTASLTKADEGKTDEMLERIKSVTSSRIIENVTDFGAYGLDEPLMSISLKTGADAGSKRLIEIGSFSEGASMYYARFDSSDSVCVITTLVEVAFDYSESELAGE